MSNLEVEKKPLVSVIMPSFETAEFIREAILSVLNQSMHDLELLIVDDCSSDGSVEIAMDAKQYDDRAKIVPLEKNVGAAVTRNIGMRLAKGRYIAFLDSDDIWYPQKLEAQLSFISEFDLPFAFSEYDVIDEDGRYLASRSVPDSITYNQLLRCCPIGCLTAIYDREKIGLVEMPLLRKRQDWATWLNIARRVGPLRGERKTLAAYRLRKGSLSRRKSALIGSIWTMYRESQHLTVLNSSLQIVAYSANGFLRQRIPGFSRRVGFI